MHNRVLATIDEARTSATAYRRGERNAVYEALKDKVDPAPKRHGLQGQARPGVQRLLLLHVLGRRPTTPARWRSHAGIAASRVLRNGRKMTPKEAAAIAAWMEEPGNIAALSRWLAERDLSNFNMFEPLDTDAKAEMAELARTPVEER